MEIPRPAVAVLSSCGPARTDPYKRVNGINDFRRETRAWLAENCPPGARTGPVSIAAGDTTPGPGDADTRLWLERMIERGWTAPTWPRQYGGGGISIEEYLVLLRELRRIDARFPLVGIAASVIGATLLEYGTEDQRRRHLPPIVRAERAWCQGYSEPSSGSDLASLRTHAEDHGDHFVVNGQKTWTSGAQVADWMFALVRTDPDAPKHDGISFVLMDMHQPGITVRPIRLISGSSPFCETFFDNAIVRKEDVLGELNKGWTVGKRLLQHERASVASLGSGVTADTGPGLADEAKRYAGTEDGLIANADLRHDVVIHEMNDRAFRLTRRRAIEEARSGGAPGPITSILKLCTTELQQEKSSLLVSMRGTQGLGWSGDTFAPRSLRDTRTWLWDRAASIYSGTNEIQRNIIAKRVLGLPD